MICLWKTQVGQILNCFPAVDTLELLWTFDCIKLKFEKVSPTHADEAKAVEICSTFWGWNAFVVKVSTDTCRINSTVLFLNAWK